MLVNALTTVKKKKILMKSFLISKFNSAHVRIKGVTANNSNQGGQSLTKGQFSSFHTLKMHPMHQMLSLMCKCLYTPSWWTRFWVMVTGQVPQSHTEGQLSSYPFLTPHWLFLNIILHQQEGAGHSERLSPLSFIWEQCAEAGIPPVLALIVS